MAQGRQAAPEKGNEASVDGPVCGIVMPISSTSGHDARHWESVLQLLERAIRDADMTPQNVWVGASHDKITSRILYNIFSAPILICDITDLNANVMLELGLRLSSKKPTIVIHEKGGDIPFDIKALHVESYPKYLTILETEVFLATLSATLKEKYEAFSSGNYKPFLSDLEIVEVLEVKSREVPFNNLVINKLDAIQAQVDQLKTSVKSAGSVPKAAAARTTPTFAQSCRVLIPHEKAQEFEELLPPRPDMRKVRLDSGAPGKDMDLLIEDRIFVGGATLKELIEGLVSRCGGKILSSNP